MLAMVDELAAGAATHNTHFRFKKEKNWKWPSLDAQAESEAPLEATDIYT